MYGSIACTTSRSQKRASDPTEAELHKVVATMWVLEIKNWAFGEQQVLLITEACLQLQQMAKEYRFSNYTHYI